MTRFCKLCGSLTLPKFSIPLACGLAGEFFACTRCQMLQSYHLDALSSEQMTRIYERAESRNLDSGAAWRQHCVARRLSQLLRLGLIRRPGPFKVLDFGAGSGFVSSYLSHKHGVDAYSYDPFSSPSYLPDRFFLRWEDVVANGPYNLVIASEVFEHFTEPRNSILQIGDVLQRQHSYLFVTTTLYRPGVHDEHWPYLAPDSGQHVAFYARASMQYVVELLGAASARTIGAENEWLFEKGPATLNAPKRIQLAIGFSLVRWAADLGLADQISERERAASD